MNARIKKAFSFFVYSNLFISCCSLSLTCETFYLLRLPPSLRWYLMLMFCCTLFVYSLHYYVKSRRQKTGPRLEWCRQNNKWVQAILVISLLLITAGVIWHYHSIFLHQGRFNWRNFAWFIIIPLISLGYSYPLIPWNRKSLRQTGWLKMLSLSFIWSFTTVVLPVWMWPGENITSPGYLLVLFFHRFFFIAALSVLFNVRDHEEDRKDGIKTIPVIAGPARTLQYGKWFFLLLNTAAGLLLLYYFQMHQLVFYAAVLIPVVLLFLLYRYFQHDKEEAAFVLRYDGLMILKALLLIFAVLIR